MAGKKIGRPQTRPDDSRHIREYRQGFGEASQAVYQGLTLWLHYQQGQVRCGKELDMLMDMDGEDTWEYRQSNVAVFRVWEHTNRNDVVDWKEVVKRFQHTLTVIGETIAEILAGIAEAVLGVRYATA